MLSKISSVYTQRNLYGHQLLLSNKESVTRFKDNGEITFGVISDKNYIQRHLPLNEFSNLCIKANNCATVIRELLEKKKYLPL
ncbi:MAG TPA: hypothetical protein VK492_06535 [Chitinophagaceae bacterium]|nr:hypothetical protein [Chitinophagaceae bacterium]